jgi:hypothetical protein
MVAIRLSWETGDGVVVGGRGVAVTVMVGVMVVVGVGVLNRRNGGGVPLSTAKIVGRSGLSVGIKTLTAVAIVKGGSGVGVE